MHINLYLSLLELDLVVKGRFLRFLRLYNFLLFLHTVDQGMFSDSVQSKADKFS